MKYFVVSDIHGHFNELIGALNKAGYDENNLDHKLISLGDMFDRGSESREVYLYLKRLNDEGKAICLKGNHEPMLEGYLDGSITSPFNYYRNGVNETLADLLHRTSPFESWCLIENNIDNPLYSDFGKWIAKARKEINEEYPDLLEWIKNLPYYYETENDIFTHASIDTYAEDWRKPHCEHLGFTDWQALTWDDGSFITKKNPTNKTIVVGHFGTGHLRKMWQIDTKDFDDNSILKTDDNKIFIDGCTILTKTVNVLVVED